MEVALDPKVFKNKELKIDISVIKHSERTSFYTLSTKK
jgi:hypothetical protein